MATPSHTARRLSWRALAGAIVLAGTLTLGAIAPSILAQEDSGGYLGYDTPQFSEGQSVAVQTDDGGGLSLRLEPGVDSGQLSALGDGVVVSVVFGPEYDDYGNGWYLVTDGSLRAYAYAGFLVASGQQTAVSSQQSAASSGSNSSSGYLGYDTPQFSEGQSVEVVTDDGGGLSLRSEPGVGAEQLSAARDGATLTVVDGPVYDGSNNGWYLVTDGSLRAYAFAGFLAASSQQAAVSSQQAAASSTSSGYLGYETPQFSEGQSVEVVTDDGGGLSLREEPNIGAGLLVAVRDGTVVTIVDGPVYDGSNNGWYLVTNDTVRAYAFAGFLVGTAASSQQSAVSSQPSADSSVSSGYLGFDTPSFSEGQSVEVRTDDGGGLSLRSDASVASEQLRALRDGATVTIVDGPVYDGSNNGWYLVSDGSVRAYAFAGFLVGTAASSQQSAVSSQQPADSSESSGYLGFDTPSFSEGQSVEVRTDDGGGLSLRSDASVASEQLRALRDGATVTIVDGPVYDGSNNGWYLITDGSIRAYAFAGFLVGTAASSQQPAASSEQPAASSSSSSSVQAARFAVGDTATTEGTTNVRNGASINGSQLGTFSGGDIVEVTDGPFFDGSGDDWYYIVGDSVQGFVMGEFLIAAAAAASEQVAPSSGPTGSFIYPLANYTFTQSYGCSQLAFYAFDPAFGCRVHNGIDLAAPSFTPILAADGGTVVESGWCDCGLGYYVKIDHGNGFATLYGHMAEMPYVRAGASVDQGDTIGPIGSTGLSTGPHIHFMIQQNGVTVNPLDYL